MKLFFLPILLLSMIFGGVKKGKGKNGSRSDNFHDSRIILKVKPETSFLKLYYEGQTQMTGLGSIDVLNREYFCVKISKLFDQVPINQKKYDELEMGHSFMDFNL